MNNPKYWNLVDQIRGLTEKNEQNDRCKYISNLSSVKASHA